MVKYITEVLKAINSDISLLQTTYKKNDTLQGSPLHVVFWCAFTSEGKFILPEGVPPYKESTEPLGMTPAQFISETKRFKNFCRTDLSSMKRESLFVQLLEAIHPEEANIMIAIKDQKLTDLYPNITRQAVADAGYIPQLSKEELKAEETEVKKSVRPRGKPSKSQGPQAAL